MCHLPPIYTHTLQCLHSAYTLILLCLAVLSTAVFLRLDVMLVVSRGTILGRVFELSLDADLDLNSSFNRVPTKFLHGKGKEKNKKWSGVPTLPQPIYTLGLSCLNSITQHARNSRR